MELRGSSVLVTGTTGGLGLAIARRVRREGARVVVSGRRAEALAPVAEELDAREVVADLSTEDGVTTLAGACGDIDVLVANAALPGVGELESFTPQQIDRVLTVNLRAPIMLARLIGENMLARGRGHVVFISSLSGKSATPVSSLYNATKFGLRGFALALRQDWRPRGVGVSCVNPGPIADAGMFHDGGAALPSGVRQRTPDDVAAAVVRAVRTGRAEIDVADPVLRMGAFLSLVAPQTAARVSRLAGADRVARELADGHADNR